MDSPARIFVKTQFNGTGASSLLLSIGIVSSAEAHCYVELPAKGLHLADVDAATLARVVAQFGRVPGARVNDRIEMSDRVTSFLSSLSGTLEVCFDLKTDLNHFQTLIGQDRGLYGRVQARDIAPDTSSLTSRQARLKQLQACAPRGIGEHHALAEALALRAAWFAQPQAEAER